MVEYSTRDASWTERLSKLGNKYNNMDNKQTKIQYELKYMIPDNISKSL